MFSHPVADLTTLIVDDEAPARSRLRQLLGRCSNVQVVGECNDGPSAIKAVHDLQPHVIFLDVRMPGMNGIEVVRKLGDQVSGHVVFVTAFDCYAVDAFEVQALDYLLKPLELDRVIQTLGRIREQGHGALRFAKESISAKNGTTKPPQREGKEGGRRLPIKIDDGYRLVDERHIESVSAQGNYVEIQCGAELFLIRSTLQAFAARLSDGLLIQVHRRHLVSLDKLEGLEPLHNGEYRLLLKSGARLTSARRYRQILNEALGI